MKDIKVTAFLPCRKGSQRVPKKNIKQFAGYQFGLIQIKLHQLIEAKSIDSVVLSTNDMEILDFAKALNNPKVICHHRVEQLSTSETSTDELVEHALDLIPEGHILWTHVTSPFLNTELYDKIVYKYQAVINDGFDSLMTTNLIHGFIWNENGPINYDRTKERWPRTQTLRPLREINSGVFLSSCENYKELQDRIGKAPYLYTLDKIQGFDIDWQDDFELAEAIVNAGLTQL